MAHIIHTADTHANFVTAAAATPHVVYSIDATGNVTKAGYHNGIGWVLYPLTVPVSVATHKAALPVTKQVDDIFFDHGWAPRGL